MPWKFFFNLWFNYPSLLRLRNSSTTNSPDTLTHLMVRKIPVWLWKMLISCLAFTFGQEELAPPGDSIPILQT